MEKTVIDILVWIGTITFLIASGLVTTKRVEGESWSYRGLNLIAGVFLISNAVYLRAYPSAGLSIAWAAIAVFTLSRTAWMKNG